MSYTEASALAVQIKDRCVAQGAPPGSANFKVCFRQEAMRENYTREANREMVRRVGRGLAAAGAASTPTHTTCTRAWNTVNCTTF